VAEAPHPDPGLARWWQSKFLVAMLGAVGTTAVPVWTAVRGYVDKSREVALAKEKQAHETAIATARQQHELELAKQKQQSDIELARQKQQFEVRNKYLEMVIDSKQPAATREQVLRFLARTMATDASFQSWATEELALVQRQVQKDLSAKDVTDPGEKKLLAAMPGESAASAAPGPKVVIAQERINLQEGVFFATDTDRILPVSYAFLERVADTIKKTGIKKVVIKGYTDNRGAAAHLQKLSQSRAEAVKAFLIGRGVAPDRLEAVGYGGKDPIADNATPVGRARNRRIEFEIKK
jgi:outer membrane protein OmpA-like peptidoglycan-associated protein